VQNSDKLGFRLGLWLVGGCYGAAVRPMHQTVTP